MKIIENFSANSRKKCPWGIQDYSICCTYDGVDDIDKTSNSLPNLSICHVNIVSLNKNIDKLEEFLNKFSHLPDIICVSETRTNEVNVKNINIPGYNFFFNNSSTRAGGAGIYIIDSLTCRELLSFRMNVPACEDVWIEVTTNPKTKFVIGTVYRHPQQNFQTFETAFKRNLKLSKTYKKYVIMGDFNIDYNCYDTNAIVKKYADEITCLGCEQMIVLPTRISPNRQSILDHIYIENSMLNEIICVGVIKFDISDHHPTIITLKTKTQRKDIARPLVRKIQTNKIEKFVEELDKNLQKHFRDDLMHKNINVLISCVKTVTDNIFPKTRVSRKQFKIAKKT